MIPKDTIDKIFEASRIEEVVGDFVSLRKRGVNMLGLCPFHKEKTPSFTVSPAKNIFKCFGCGKGGSPVDFIMEHEQMNYPEALRYLAKKYGITIEEQERTADEIAQMNERESLFHVTNFANDFFQQQLHDTEEGQAIGLSYLKERGLRMDIIRKFQIGYAPEAWDSLTKQAMSNGYKEEFLEKTGLTILKEGKRYDRFRARIIFPIFSVANRPIAFGGRILDSTKSAAKYVNSPESEIYHKSAVLYGLNWARTEISRQNVCYLCEGYMDVVAMHQAGIENVVASSGTSLTTDQIRLIKRYTPNVTILYDGDPAGIKASFRGIDMILEEGMNVRVLLFPEGEDPDSFARARTADEVSQYIKANAVDFITFKTNLLLAETNNDPLKKADLVREIIASIALIPENITREAYVKQCATMMNMEESVLIYSLNQARRNAYKQKKKRAEGETAAEQEITPFDILKSSEMTERQVIGVDADSLKIRERDVVRLLMLYGEKTFTFLQTDENGVKKEYYTTVAEFILNDLQYDEITFENELYRVVYDYFASCQERGDEPNQNDLKFHEDSKIRALTADFLANNYTLSGGWEKRRIHTKTEEDQLFFACSHALLALKGFHVAKQLSEAEAALKEIPAEDAEAQIAQLKEIMKLTAIKQDIALKLTRTRMPN